MANSKCRWEAPKQGDEWSQWLAAGLRARNRWRLPVLLLGILFASVQEILEAFADRTTIEQDFHDVKEVWGSGQQQVRHIWTNLAVYNLNLWTHRLVEVWAWRQSGERLVDRGDWPWGDAQRRPSHADGFRETNDRRLPTPGRCHEKSSNWPKASWHWPPKLKQLSESAEQVGATGIEPVTSAV